METNNGPRDEKDMLVRALRRLLSGAPSDDSNLPEKLARNVELGLDYLDDGMTPSRPSLYPGFNG